MGDARTVPIHRVPAMTPSDRTVAEATGLAIATVAMGATPGIQGVIPVTSAMAVVTPEAMVEGETAGMAVAVVIPGTVAAIRTEGLCIREAVRTW